MRNPQAPPANELSSPSYRLHTLFLHVAGTSSSSSRTTFPVPRPLAPPPTGGTAIWHSLSGRTQPFHFTRRSPSSAPRHTLFPDLAVHRNSPKLDAAKPPNLRIAQNTQTHSSGRVIPASTRDGGVKRQTSEPLHDLAHLHFVSDIIAGVLEVARSARKRRIAIHA